MCSRASSWRLLGVVYRQPLLLELAHHRPGHRLLRRLVPPLPSACSSGAQGAAPRGDRPCVHRRHPQHRAGVEPAVASTSDERGLRAALPREHVRRVRVGLDGSRRDRHRRQRGRASRATRCADGVSSRRTTIASIGRCGSRRCRRTKRRNPGSGFAPAARGRREGARPVRHEALSPTPAAFRARAAPSLLVRAARRARMVEAHAHRRVDDAHSSKHLMCIPPFASNQKICWSAR